MSAPAGGRLPTGTLTFLFTDIEGSTGHLRRLGAAYADLLALHHRRIREALVAGGGTEVGTEGDAFFAVFPFAQGALDAVVAAQRALHGGPWPDGADVRVRMGLHTGEGEVADGSYVGLDVHRAARIGDAGHGGQVLVSATTSALVRGSLPRGVELRDLGLHSLAGLEHVERLYQVVIEGLPSEFPPLRSLIGTPHNLPRMLSSFVGRELELLEVAELIRTHRLLTLTGPGGSGKTRLALEAGLTLLDAFPDGVWLVELSSIADPALVPQALGTVLGVQSGPGRTVEAAVADHLRPRRCLVILDNCEHVLPGCAPLAVRLVGGEGTHVLATSREPLAVPGELQYPVRTLAVPAPGPLPPEQLREHAAVRLFEDRAAALRPGFRVTAENADAVAAIVRRLEGIPLAIELAAARVKFLSATEIAARLDDRFRLLHGAGYATTPRHQTLRAVMDWSYELLTDRERLAFERLSVFAGGWTLEGAEFLVAGDDIVDVEEVVELLASLVDKSLVVVSERAGASRYRALETVREYGWQRLVERGGHDAVVLRHRLWCLAFVERASMNFWSRDMPRWLDALETEHDNVRAAVERATGPDGTEVGLRLCGALWPFWDLRGHIREGLQRLERLLARPEARHASAEAQARAMDAAAWLAGLQNDFERAMKWAGPALELWRGLGDREGIAWSLALQGMLSYNLGRAEQAEGFFADALQLARELDNLIVTGWALFGLGHVALERGAVDEAAAKLEESLAGSRRLEIPWGIAWCSFSLGVLAMMGGRYGEAHALIRESLTLRWTLGDRRTMCDSLSALASLHGLLGQARTAALLDGAAAALREATGARLLPWLQPKLDEGLAVARRALGTGAFEAARSKGRSLPLEHAVTHALSAGQSEREPA